MVKSVSNFLEYDKRCSRMEFLIRVIRDISDLNYQHKLWIEGIPGLLGSWEETMCSFFDDADIDEFLKDLTPESNPEFGLSAHQIEELWKLRNIMNNYSDATPKYMNPREVLKDPRWHEVVECAKETLKSFQDYRVPADYGGNDD